ncbi:MAG: hypothetical protein NVS3B26_27990 [Mycobacteriales bacterium]
MALRWYEALLGPPPAFFPNDRESVWQVGDKLFVYVDVRADHTGHAVHTVFVEDLKACLAEIEGRGLSPTGIERYENGVGKAIFNDPDGNEFGLAGRLNEEG